MSDDALNSKLSDLGARIKDLRLSLGYTQEELGKKVGMSAQKISNIERGYTIGFVDDIGQLAKALGTHLEDLISNRKPPITGSSQATDNNQAITVPAISSSKPISDFKPHVIGAVLLPKRGKIPAGTPQEMFEETPVFIPVPETLLIGASSDTYLLEVAGNSLSGDGIYDGQLMVVDPNDKNIINHKIYILKIKENEYVARHIERRGNKLRIYSTNDNYRDLDSGQVEVLGRVRVKGNWDRC